jgi:OFA family oxalate/formate antiporter-like MFS transporter
MSHSAAASTDAGSAATAPGDDANPTKGRWLLVGAALLLQFSIGAVYAWSVLPTRSRSSRRSG